MIKQMKTILFCISFLVTGLYSGRAQAKLTISDSSVIGIWKGRSLCQVKNAPCHDEIIVYYISKAEGIDTFNIRADKVVSGVEEDMGILSCKFERKTNQLVCAAAKGRWTFNIKDRSIDGKLMVQGTLFRIVKLSKEG